MIALRDPFGVRPLAIGKVDDAYVVASETCAFDIINAQYIRDVEPGEMVIINENGIRSIQALKSPRKAFCVSNSFTFQGRTVISITILVSILYARISESSSQSIRRPMPTS